MAVIADWEFHGSISSMLLEIGFMWPLPIELDQIDKRTHDTIKITIIQPVTFFRTSAVDVPKIDSPGSPPKEAPRPKLLLSWIKITQHKMAEKNIKVNIDI
jgi:hypothetical protein